MSSNNIQIKLQLEADITKARTSINELAQTFSNIGGLKGDGLIKILNQIDKELDKLASKSGPSMKKVGDFSSAEKSVERIDSLLKTLRTDIEAISKAGGKDLEKMFPSQIADNIKKASNAIKTYNSQIDSKKNIAIKEATKAYNDQINKVKSLAQDLRELQNIQNGTSQKKMVTMKEKSSAIGELETAKTELKNYQNALKEAEGKMAEFKARKATLFEKGTQNYSSEFRALNQELQNAQVKFGNAKQKADELKNSVNNMVVVTDLSSQIKQAETNLQNATMRSEEFKGKLESITLEQTNQALKTAIALLGTIEGVDLSNIKSIEDITRILEGFTKDGINSLQTSTQKANQSMENLSDTNDRMSNNIKQTTEEVRRQNETLSEVEGLKHRIGYFFSLTNSVNLFQRGIRSALTVVKDLDKAMTETAVVTDFSIGDMWSKLPEYTKMANELGVATQGVYEASTLYYQQGLQTEEVMALTTETLKMARIAGLECADATNLMTAALRGFNMEINETSAQRVNDVYSELAAITAADTNEIATAMTKTASIAKSANMELETTAALLAQMIETTREPAETAGTAMKTIIARFTEMKNAVSDTVTIDGEEVSVNKVDAALASVGVSLKNTKGEFRELDDVFLELASKWDSLDIMSQRYIATTAAGSRQQSRFIAMMQDYDRTMQLVDAAYNSAGSSSKQFEKTQESLESKLARLKNAWNTFLMGIADDKIIKTLVDALTGLLNAYNNLTSGMDGVGGSMVRLGTVFAGLRIAKLGVDKLAFHFAMVRTEALKAAGAITTVGTATTGAGKGRTLSNLATRFTNMGAGNGFVLTPKINSAPIDSWFVRFKKDLATLSLAMNGALNAQELSLGFQKINGEMALTGAVITATGQTMEMSLSEVGMAALLASEAIEEIGEDGTQGALTASAAVEILEKQYKDLDRQIKIVQARVKTGKMNPNVGNNYINVLRGKQANIGEDIFRLNGSQSWGDSITQKFNVFNKTLKEGGGIKKAFSSTFKGLGTSLKGVGVAAKGAAAAVGKGLLGTLAAIPGPGWAAVAVIGAIAAATGVMYAVWKSSASQTTKKVAEMHKATLDNLKTQLEATKKEVNELEQSWNTLTSEENSLDNLTEGTMAWQQQLEKVNTQVKDILKKYPDLYKYLSIDESGQWSLDEEGYQEYLSNEKEEVNSLEAKELYLQGVTNFSEAQAEAVNEQKDKNGLVDWTKTTSELESSYEAGLRQAYEYANKYKISTGEKAGLNEVSIEEIINDPETAEFIQKYSEATGIREFAMQYGWNDYWGGGEGTNDLTSWFAGAYNSGDPRAAYAYWEKMSKAEESFREQGAKLARAYAAESGANYSDSVLDAVEETMYDNDRVVDMTKKQNSDYTGGTDGSGLNGKGSWADEVQRIMEKQGYEKVESKGAQNIYKNKTTGEYVNVDRIGGNDAAHAKTSTRKIDGKDEKVKTWSDEYVKSLDTLDKNTEQYKEDSLKLAKVFANDIELAKLKNGDISANLTKIKTTEDIVSDDGTILLDIDESIEEFKKARDEKMEDLNNKFKSLDKDGNMVGVFSKNENGEYNQKTYEAAQGVIEFSDSVKDLGNATASNLTSAYLIMLDMENSSLNLNTAFDTMGENASTLATSLKESGVSAETFKNFVNDLNFSSSIAGARQLKNMLDKGGTDAAMAGAVITADSTLAGGNNFFGVGNQFKELINSEGWKKTETSLSEIYNLTGEITADNIRDLAKENNELASVLETSGVKASSFAKIMEDVERGSLNVSQVTEDLIKLYDDLYYSVDLAGEAIARLEKAKIRDSETKLGKIYSESWSNIKELLDRGAYGDSQLDDYMSQLIGEREWNLALASAGGNKSEAINNLDSTYGLSQNTGNMYGSWVQGLNRNGGSIANGAITLDSNGLLNYDLSKVKNTKELVALIAKDLGVSMEYAETMVGDMKTYSKTFAADLEALDKAGTLTSYLKYNITTDTHGVKTLNISEQEKAAFARSRNQTVEQFEADMQSKYGVSNFEDRTYKESGYTYTTTDADGNVVADWTDNTALEQTKDLAIDVPITFTSDGKTLSDDTLNGLLKIDQIREIVLDPTIPDETKKTLFKDIGLEDAVAAGLTGENAKGAAEWFAQYNGVQTYNEMGAKLVSAMELMATTEVFIPMGISLPVTIPGLTVAGHEIWPETSFELFSGTLGGITVGGTTVSGATAGITSGAFTPLDLPDPYVPKEEEIEEEEDDKEPGDKTGDAYEKKHDEDNAPDQGSGSGSGENSEPEDPAEANADRQIKAIERIQETLDREAELIDKLPEEIAAPLKLMNMGENLVQEAKKDEVERNKLDALLGQQDTKEDEAKYLGQYYYYDEVLDAYMYNVEAINKLKGEERQKVEEEIAALQELNDKINETEDAIDGGKVQKLFRGLGKGVTELGEKIKHTPDPDDLIYNLIGGKSENGFNRLLAAIGSGLITLPIAPLNNLNTKGLIRDEEKAEEVILKIEESEFGQKLGDNAKDLISQIIGEGNTYGIAGSLVGTIGEGITGLGDFLTFDVMSQGLDMFNQMQSMAEKAIQTIIQYVQTIVNWWINREDWLYNLLTSIEKEVQNFNRQENVEDRFRAYSTEGYDELMEAYQAMQASLDEQYRLNKQLIASRQSEMMLLNLSNLPFYPAFHYDRKKERMVENPWVYNIYTLLLDLGALLPMIGGFFPVIKSLMEDNKKRMEEMDAEISDARDRLEELEKEQLELNTQYMEDQIELERLVMDSIIEKQQEEIDKLSLLNDAITDANAKLIETLNNNLEKIREQRENEKKEEELGEKERRLAYLRQDTSGANHQEIKKLEEELEDKRRDYTDELIDQKISAIEEQNDKAAEQRQKQIDLLQSQLDYTQRYGLQWEEAQKLIKNGFDSEGRLKVGTDLYNMLMAKEEITSLGMGSASEWQALKEWEITGVAAKVYQDINKVWERLIFGPLKSSGHNEDAQQKYEGDSLFKDIGESIQNFIKTGYLSGDESTSIFGKTLIPWFQELFNKNKNNDTLTQADNAGYIEETATQTGEKLGSSFIARTGNAFSDIGNSITEGFKNLIEDKNTNTQTSTQTVGDINMEFHINSEDGESGMDIAESIVSAFKQGISNLSIFK